MEKVQIAPFQVIGITVRTINKNDQGLKDIGGLFERFMSKNLMKQIPNTVGTDIYCIYTDYESDHNGQYTTLLGCKVSTLDQIPNGMVGKSFHGGTYLKFVAKGDLNQGIIAKKWMEIWKTDLPRKYTADFDVYGKTAQNPKDAEVPIYIAI